MSVVKEIKTTIPEFVEDLCSESQGHVVLVACCRRSWFLEQLKLYDSARRANAASREQERTSTSEEQDDEVPDISSISLTEPTLGLLAVSTTTKLIFCPSIPTFRALTPTLPLREDIVSGSFSKIIILDMLALHHGTSEFTIQGLSRSFAMVASAQHSLQTEFEILECMDYSDLTNPHRGPLLWETEVPLLSGSVKIGEAGQGWATRRTRIRTFAERWVDFVGSQ